MIRNLTTRAVLILALVTALAIVGCGSDDSGGAYGGQGTSGAEKTASSPGKGAGGATVSVASVGKLGPILVDAEGFTLYDFHKDKGGKSACYATCAQIWPPLTTEGTPRPSNGALASKLATTKRSDGTVQVTYAGHPLYTYRADNQPGEANGNDIGSFGAEWYALQASGEEAED